MKLRHMTTLKELREIVNSCLLHEDTIIGVDTKEKYLAPLFGARIEDGDTLVLNADPLKGEFCNDDIHASAA